MSEDSDRLMAIYSELEIGEEAAKPDTREQILHAPFGYPGGKSRAIMQILPQLPYRDGYCEVFGGSGAVLLSRKRSNLEVYNDRYGGVVSFYRCLRDYDLMNQLIQRLELTVHSREEFLWCKETWDDPKLEHVERAARWYYMNQYSFACVGRNFGRSTNCAKKARIAGKIQRAFPDFYQVHNRLRDVQIENLDWQVCLKDFDDHGVVFYLDPPYYPATTTDNNIYRDRTMSANEHVQMLEVIMQLKGFVALSGYANEVYDSYKWDHRYTWEQYVSMGGGSQDEAWRLVNRKNTTETLYVKEAR